MVRKTRKKLLVLIFSSIFLVLIFCATSLTYKHLSLKPAPVPENTVEPRTQDTTSSPTQPTEAYSGKLTVIANSFSIKTPNGWTGSVSNSTNFTAIMFARPNQLTSLTYNPQTPPIVDQAGIQSWSGLTEHFYIIAPTESRQFNPNSHLEVTSESFEFDDGVIGLKYTVVKHAEEAKKWGGLQKDTEWQGRTYIYEKGRKRVEAHLALYASTPIDIEFYESVIRTIGGIQ